MINKYDKLHSKIMNRLNSSVVESNSEIVSMSDVIKSVRIELGLYHTILVNRQKRIIDKLNKSIGYSKFTPSFVSKKLPKVVDIKNSVNANGEVFVEIIFANGKNVILSGNSLDVQIVGIADKEIVDFVSKNNEIFTINLGTLIAFAQEYPGMEMNFGEKCKNKLDQRLDDGFISCDINIANPNSSFASLSSLDDLITSRENNLKYSELYDYISFYNNELLSKSTVSVNDLNPFLKQCVLKYLSLSNEKDFTLSL